MTSDRFMDCNCFSKASARTASARSPAVAACAAPAADVSRLVWADCLATLERNCATRFSKVCSISSNRCINLDLN